MAGNDSKTKGGKNGEKKTTKESSKQMEVVNKPDEKAFKENMDKEAKAIDEIKSKINALQAKIDTLAGGKEEYYRKKGEYRARLDEFQEQIDALERQRANAMSSLDNKKKENKESKQNFEKMKKSVGFSSHEEIDNKIQALENELMTSTIHIKKEKEILQQIKQLKATKPLVNKIANMEQQSSTQDNSFASLKGNLDTINAKLVELRTMRREVSEKYRQLVDERQQATGPVRDLIEEKDKLSKELNEHFAQKRAYQDKYNEEMWKYQNYLGQQRQERNEKIREERQRRQADQERESLQKELERAEALPLEDEVALLSQTLAYVQKLVNDTQDTPDKPIQPTQTEKREAPKEDGVLLPKNQREEEYFYAPVQKKKTEKKVKEKKEKPKTIKHDIGTLSYFELCGVEAPVSVSDLADCLKKLEGRLEEHKQLQHARAAEAEERKRQIVEQLAALDAQA